MMTHTPQEGWRKIEVSPATFMALRAKTQEPFAYGTVHHIHRIGRPCGVRFYVCPQVYEVLTSMVAEGGARDLDAAVGLVLGLDTLQ